MIQKEEEEEEKFKRKLASFSNILSETDEIKRKVMIISDDNKLHKNII